MGRRTIIRWTGAPIDWTGEIVAIVASGPSAKTTRFESLIEKARVIAVNLSWQLVPFADLLYASDAQWWDLHNGVPEFAGRKMTSSPKAAERHRLDVAFCLGNNSGLRAMQVADQLGARRIVLIGFDMHERGGMHWHEPHGKGLHNPRWTAMTLWRSETEKLGRYLRAEVINCTPGSALRCFPIMTLDEALNGNDGSTGRADQSRHSAVSGRLVAG